MPQVVGAAAAWVAANVTAVMVFRAVVFVAMMAYSINAQRQLKKDAIAAYNASLRDRNITVRSSVSPRQIIYGKAATGGTLVYAQSSGGLSELLTLVLVLAGHEVDSIESVYLDDNDIYPLEVGGAARLYSRYHHLNTSTLGQVQATVAVDGKIQMGLVPAAVAGVWRQNLFTVAWTNIPGENIPHNWTPGNAYVTVDPSYSGQSLWVWYSTNVTGSTAYVSAAQYLGGAGQAAWPWLVSNSAGKWTNNHVGAGVAYIGLNLTYNEDIFPTGIPPILAVVKGKKVYDPRSGLTVWSDNPALIARDYLISPLGFGCTTGEIDDTLITAAANICDEWVTLYDTGTVTATNGSPTVTGSGTSFAQRMVGESFKASTGSYITIASVQSATQLTLSSNFDGTTGGTAYSVVQRRYKCNTVLSTDASPLENLDAILSSMAGTRSYSQGKWRIHAGAYATPVMALDDSMIVEGQVAIVPRAPKSQLFNEVKGVYIDPIRNWQPTDFPPVKNATYATQDGGATLATDIALPSTTNAWQAQRIAKIMLEQARQALVVQATFNLSAYKVQPGDNVTLTVSRYGFSSKVFKVINRKFDPAKGVELLLREEASAVYDWAYGEATTVDVAPNSDLPSPFSIPSNLADFALTSTTADLTRLADGTIISRMRATWTASTDPRVNPTGSILIEYRQCGDDSWKQLAPIRGDETIAYIAPVEDGKDYYVRYRTQNALGVRSEWAWEAHTVSGKTQAPPNLSSMTVEVLPDGTRRFTITAPTGVADGATIAVRHITGTSSTWSAMTHLFSIDYSPELATYYFETNKPIEGTWSFGAKLIDSSGNECSTATFITAAVLSSHPKRYDSTFNMIKNADFTSSLGTAFDYPNGFTDARALPHWTYGWYASTGTTYSTSTQYRNYNYGHSLNVGVGGCVMTEGTKVDAWPTTFVYLWSDYYPIGSGEAYELTAYCNPSNCVAQVGMLFYSTATVAGNGTGFYSGQEYTTGGSNGTYSGSLSDPMTWTRLFHGGTSTAAGFIRAVLYKGPTISTGTADASAVAWHKVQLCRSAGGTSRAEALPWVPPTGADGVYTGNLGPEAATEVFRSAPADGNYSTSGTSTSVTYVFNKTVADISWTNDTGESVTVKATFSGRFKFANGSNCTIANVTFGDANLIGFPTTNHGFDIFSATDYVEISKSVSYVAPSTGASATYIPTVVMQFGRTSDGTASGTAYWQDVDLSLEVIKR